MRRPLILLMITILAVSACGRREDGVPKLHKFGPGGEGPDEFRILPSKELQQPESYAALPAPTPGGANLVDQYPLLDGRRALGGGATTQSVPRSDSALVSYASRSGVPENIRQITANEDLEFRKRNSRFTGFKIVQEDRYNRVYRRQVLDANSELWRWRRLGVQTPTAALDK